MAKKPFIVILLFILPILACGNSAERSDSQAAATLRPTFTIAVALASDTSTPTEPPATNTPMPTDTPIPPTNTAAPTAMPASDTPMPAPTAVPATATAPPPAAPTAPPPTAGPPPGVALVAAGVWKCPAGAEGARYVGSSESDKFHNPYCAHAKKIEDEYRLCFLDKPSAIAYGYVACGVCRP